MNTLNQNYSRNVAILKTNLKRGLTLEEAEATIEHFKNTFKKHDLYNVEEKQFIGELKEAVNDHFGIKEVKATDLMASMGIDVQVIN